MVRVVLDTNVLVSALLSKRGASFRLLQMLGSSRWKPVLSATLCLEYEDVLLRPGLLPGHSAQNVSGFINFIVSNCLPCQVYFTWRPYLPDPKDDMVFELALSGGAQFIITHNLRDFRGVGAFGIQAVTPDVFLRTLPLV